MATFPAYHHIVEQVIQEYVAQPFGDFQREAVVDREAGRYLVLTMGWQGYRRVHHSIIHIDIIEDKVWIQEDNTEEGITVKLLEAGIPKQQIVLGFQHPTVRPLGEYAPA